MEIVIQIMMGISLAACAGLRAWLPMLAIGLLAKTGHIDLQESFSFLARTDVLIGFGIATVVECIGDKIIAVDHFLDAAGTLLRPVAGAILASSVLVGMDPATALVLGILTGGGTSLTVHAGKTVARAKSSALAFLHGGFANAALSVGEDLSAGLVLALVIFIPVVAFFLALIALGVAIVLVVALVKTGVKLVDFLKNRRSYKIANQS
jgi:hypothetical protein